MIYIKTNKLFQANKINIVNEYIIVSNIDMYYTCDIVKLINNINYGFWI